MSSWWRPELDERLSQGDVLEHVAMAAVQHPATVLHPIQTKGSKRAYEESATELPAKEPKLLLARGNAVRVLVISHSCELDKLEKKARVLVAPIALASGLDEAARNTIMGRQRRSLFPLYDVPELGDCYADLRLISAVPREFLADARRLASLHEIGLEQLRNHVVDFLFRVRPP